MSKVGALTVPSSTLSDHHNATACPQSLLYLVFRLPGEPSKSIIGTLDCRRRTGNLSGGFLEARSIPIIRVVDVSPVLPLPVWCSAIMKAFGLHSESLAHGDAVPAGHKYPRTENLRRWRGRGLQG
jgi:hypothetical protein